MKTFVDQATGKKFVLGSRGFDALSKRVASYVETLKENGVGEAAIHPNNIPKGATFECSACDQKFVFDGDDQDAFVESIKVHGRGHGQCQITPVL